jgi:hypothetical protein
MARPKGMTTIAGPGRKISATPAASTLNPAIPTATFRTRGRYLAGFHRDLTPTFSRLLTDEIYRSSIDPPWGSRPVLQLRGRAFDRG